MIFIVLTKLSLMPKLNQDDALLENAMKKLQLWLIFQQHNSAMAMNVVVTSHLPVCLYSVAGVKVNRQVARTR
jgi:uncharacterized membrane protein